jgi:endo-1,4-beta-xylanase
MAGLAQAGCGDMMLAASPRPGLAALAALSGRAYGAAFDREMRTDKAYRALYRREVSMVTTENAMKFDHLRPHGPEADFSFADWSVKFAEANGLALRGHNLIWNDNLPDWLARMSRRRRQRLFDAHIDEVAGRYVGRVRVWDVVNEPFWPEAGEPGHYGVGPWYDAFGPAYISRALHRAATADRRALLAINEAHTEQQTRRGKAIRSALLALIEDLLQAGAPLHVIGLQGHLQPHLPFDGAAFEDFLWRIAGFGLGIHITELDVNDRSLDRGAARRDAQVAEWTARFLAVVLKVPAVSAVVSWQLSDRYSFYTGDKSLFQADPRPLPLDRDYRRKPVYFAMARRFEAAAQ